MMACDCPTKMFMLVLPLDKFATEILKPAKIKNQNIWLSSNVNCRSTQICDMKWNYDIIYQLIK